MNKTYFVVVWYSALNINTAGFANTIITHEKVTKENILDFQNEVSKKIKLELKLNSWIDTLVIINIIKL